MSESQSDDIYFSFQISCINEEYFTTYESSNKEDNNCLKTEVGLNIPENFEDKNSNNSEEKFKPSSIYNIISNEKSKSNKNMKKNKNKTKKTNCSSSTFTKKKRGRRNKNSTETDGHTAEDKDNQIIKYWRIFFNCILTLANSISKPYGLVIKPTNFIQQFGSNIVENEDFIKLKFYKYFTYNTVFKDNEKHEDIGLKNRGVIKKMIFTIKDPKYIALMKSRIEFMYNKYINNNKSIKINGEALVLNNFNTINDVVEKERLKGKSEKDLEDFKNNAISLVDYIKDDGEKIKRKKEITKIKKYIIIPELEYDEEE